MAAPRISLEMIETLDAIERRGSFARAAEDLGKVPSAVSYTIQRLEELLDISITARHGRRSVLTPAGRLLLDRGRLLLAGADGLADDARSLARGWEARIRIAVDTILHPSDLYPRLRGFCSAHPHIELQVSEQVLGGTWETLLSDRVDLVIGAPAPVPTHQGISARLLARIERVFAVSRDHPLCRAEQPLSRERLAGERMVVVRDSSRDEIPRNTGLLNEAWHYYVESMEHKIEAQCAGLGAGFVPYHRIRDRVESGEMVILPVVQEVGPAEVYVAWKTVNRGKGLKALRECLDGFQVR